MTVAEQARLAREAAHALSVLPDSVRKRAMLRAADALIQNTKEIVAANRRDFDAAKADGLAAPLLARLTLDEKKLAILVDGLRALAATADPLGHTTLARELAPGLDMYRVTCPIGVVGVVFESRPDALVQIASLCARSGNAVLLKGGREALETCRALHRAMDQAVRAEGFPEGWAVLLESREDVHALLSLDDLVDLIIPRGSNAFVRQIMDSTRIPVLGHAEGLCHVYIDRAADIPMAVRVVTDSKTQYVAVCNAVETLLIHSDIAPAALPPLCGALLEKGVKLLGCDRTRAIVPMDAAGDDAWDAEYLDYILSIKIVDSLDEAVRHINQHGSHHTDAIVTGDAAAARSFLTRVDSAGCYWNCSTRFADGYRYGFSAEVGVATGKLHARGPMGMEGLCTYKYMLMGSGNIVGEKFDYTHRDLDRAFPFSEAGE